MALTDVEVILMELSLTGDSLIDSRLVKGVLSKDGCSYKYGSISSTGEALSTALAIASKNSMKVALICLSLVISLT